ncbi:hypothetical protein D9M72_580900 [compost metagenome]
MVGALEHHNLVPASDGACGLNGIQVGLRSGICKAQKLHGGKTLSDEVGHLSLRFCMAAHRPSLLQRLHHRFAQYRIRVTIEARGVLTQEVPVPVAVQ